MGMGVGMKLMMTFITTWLSQTLHLVRRARVCDEIEKSNHDTGVHEGPTHTASWLYSA
jgi:hypothetical protein